MQDVFVGGLCVIGFLLATYMAGEARTWDFWASLIAGLAVLGVVFFPTTRSGLPAGAPACGSVPEPSGCSAVEQTLGEHQTAVIHGACAIVFILFLAVMSFLFATSEVLSSKDRPRGPGRSGGQGLFQEPGAVLDSHLLHAGHPGRRGMGILRAQASGQLTPLYIGEVASVWAFALSWILAGLPNTAPARAKTSRGVTASPSPAAGAALPR